MSRQRQQTKTKVTYQSGAEPRARGKKEAAETLVSASVTDNNTVAEKKHSKLSGNSFGCRVASFFLFFSIPATPVIVQPLIPTLFIFQRRTVNVAIERIKKK